MRIESFEFLVKFENDRWVVFSLDISGCPLGELASGETPVSAMIAAEIAVRRRPRFATVEQDTHS